MSNGEYIAAILWVVVATIVKVAFIAAIIAAGPVLVGILIGVAWTDALAISAATIGASMVVHIIQATHLEETT